MNRNVVIGGVAGVAGVLGVAGWYFLSGPGAGPGGGAAVEPTGPITLNAVSVVTEHEAAQSPDGRMLSLTFPKFELVTKSGETTSAVFSTTWRLKLGSNERAVAAIASLQGYMKSAGTPPPVQPAAAPAAAPAADAPAPATADTAVPPPVTDGATPPPADKPAATPAAAAPAQPVAGNGVARVIVSIGGETSVTEWRDWTGNGAEHQLAKAVAYAGTSADLRDGATVPVIVTIELAGNASTETISRLSSLVLRVVAEEAPIPTETTAGTAPDTAAPTATPAADTAATPPAAPADGAAAAPPAETPAATTPTP